MGFEKKVFLAWFCVCDKKVGIMGDRIKAKMRLQEVEIKGESPDFLKQFGYKQTQSKKC